MTTMDANKAGEIRYRERQLQDWLGKRTSYHPSELPAGIVPPTNEERSALEVYEFKRDRPEKYFVYINESTKRATTWTGDDLGEVFFGKEWRDSFGGTRVSIRWNALTGDVYSGTYFKSSGDYARVKKLEMCAWKFSHE